MIALRPARPGTPCPADGRPTAADAAAQATGGETPFCDHLPSQPDGIGVIDRQHANRHVADRRQADQFLPDAIGSVRPIDHVWDYRVSQYHLNDCQIHKYLGPCSGCIASRPGPD